MALIASITYENIIKYLRQTIIDSLAIDDNNVKNATTTRGVSLQKVIDNTKKYTSLSLNDTFILFELTEDDGEKYYVMHEKDNSDSVITNYSMGLKVYGNHSHYIIQKLLTVFKNQDILIDLRQKGIYVKGMTNPKINHEFINNTLWARCDSSINIMVRLNFTNEDATQFEKIGNILVNDVK